MAKKRKSSKQRKQRKPNVPVYTVPSEAQENAASSAAKPVAVTAAQAPISNPLAAKDATTDSIDWAKEYPFFAPDMKKLGIVVALMVVLLLAMNLIFIYVL